MPESNITIKGKVRRIEPTDDVLSPHLGCPNCGQDPLLLLIIGMWNCCSVCRAMISEVGE